MNTKQARDQMIATEKMSVGTFVKEDRNTSQEKHNVRSVKLFGK